MTDNLYIGAYINKSYFNNLFDIIKYINKIGGNALQIYVGDNVHTSLKTKLNYEKNNLIEHKKFLKEKKIKLIIHGIVSLNFCNPLTNKYKWGLDNIIYDLKFSNKIGGLGCVIHLGTKITKNYNLSNKDCINNYLESLKYVLNNSPKSQKIFIETCSDQKNKIGGTIEELSILYKKLKEKYKSRVKICIDSAHIFEAGYPINTSQGVINYFKKFDEIIGIKNIKIMHINDSDTPLNSKIDRHAPIGEGYIFSDKKGGSLNSLIEIYKICKKYNIIMILETSFKNYENEIKLIKSLNCKVGGNKEFKNNIIKIFSFLEKFHLYSNDPKSKYIKNSYTRVLSSIKNYNNNINNYNKIKKLNGVGNRFINKIFEIKDTGSLKMYNDLKKNSNLYYKINKLSNINSILGIGPKKALNLYNQGYNNINKIKKGIKNGKLKVSKLVKCGLDYKNDLNIKINRKEALLIKNLIKKSFPNSNYEFILAGSYLRGKNELKDIDLIISYNDNYNINIQDVIKNLKKINILVSICSIGKDYLLCLIKNNKLKNSLVRHLDIRLVKKSYLPYYLLYFGSGINFSKKIRTIASMKGYKLDQYGIYNKNSGEKIKLKIKKEEDIFKFFNLKYIEHNKR